MELQMEVSLLRPALRGPWRAGLGSGCAEPAGSLEGSSSCHESITFHSDSCLVRLRRGLLDGKGLLKCGQDISDDWERELQYNPSILAPWRRFRVGFESRTARCRTVPRGSTTRSERRLPSSGGQKGFEGRASLRALRAAPAQEAERVFTQRRAKERHGKAS